MNPEKPFKESLLSGNPKAPYASGLRSFLRRNIILFIPTTIYLGIMFLALVQIDRFNFTSEKSEIIKRMIEVGALLNDDTRTELSALVDQYNRISVEQVYLRQQQIEQMQWKMEDLLQKNPFVWQVQYTDRNNTVLVIVSKPERLKQQNDFSNSLLFRDFSKSLTNIRQSTNGVSFGSIEIRYASPKGIPEIEALASRWRLIALAIMLGLILIYAGLLLGLFLPTRRVLTALDKGPEIGARFITPARTLLERYYNNLARDATLSVLSTTMRGYIADETLIERDELSAKIPRLICELFPFQEILLLTFQRNVESGQFELRALESRTDSVDFQSSDQLKSHEKWSIIPQQYQAYIEPQDQSRSAFMAQVVRESDQQSILLYLEKKQLPAPNNPWWAEVFLNIANEVTFVLEKLDAQRRLIMQEKNKANISLSRNLGHDLTNIIATSKLELMTVKTFLNLPKEALLESETKKQIFKESLESLLNNTKFLQETVNLYRSFTYLSKPRFERVSLNDLVREVSQLFQLSVSRNIQVSLDFEEDLPELTVEPRLLRLALFNLLNNGADAIKLVSSVDSPKGSLILATSKAQKPGYVALDVIDSGSGIQDQSGRLLEDHEVKAIFQLGYTTKEQGTGEGLGLNWVRQIVEDFHHGEILARNRREGGVMFRLLLPLGDEISLETKGEKSDSNSKVPVASVNHPNPASSTT